MSWNINKPGDYINGPLTVVGVGTFNNHVAIGATLSAWAGISAKVIEFGNSGSNNSLWGNGANDIHLVSNSYFNGSNWIYNRAAAATRYNQLNGTHTWYSAASGAAGNVASWIQAMTLDASSRLVVGGGSAYGRSTFTVGTGLQGGTTTNVGSALYDIDYAASGDINTRLSFVNSNGVTNAAIDRIGNPYFSDTGHLAFLTRASGGSLSERARFNATGAFVLAGGATAANGVGITFPAAQSASTDANTLDDYEEGTFTASVEGSTTAGAATYVVRNSTYTKVGRLVQFQIHLAWNSGSGTGALRINGLPFTANGTYIAVPQVYPIDIALVAGFVAVASVQPGTSYINIYQIPSGGGSDGTVTYDAAGQLIVTGTYIV